MLGYTEILERMGLETVQLSEEDYLRAVLFTVKKARRAGKGAWYVEILLPDVIREMIFSRYTAERCEAMKRKEEAPC